MSSAFLALPVRRLDRRYAQLRRSRPDVGFSCRRFVRQPLCDRSQRSGSSNLCRWPPDFDQYETLLRLGRAAGHTVRWADPVNGSSLEWTIADLARQRPGISVAELAELLDLDEDITSTIADRAVIKHGVSIRIEN